MNQSIDQRINQPINQSIDQRINQSINCFIALYTSIMAFVAVLNCLKISRHIIDIVY